MKRVISFGSPASAETEVLSFLAKAIDRSEFERLAGEAGFSPPNTFGIERMMEPLELRRFPLSDWYEYEWALYECGWDSLRQYSPAMKAYLAAVYVYCNKRREWSVVIDSDFYLLAIEATLDYGGAALARQFGRFIEWLNDWVQPDEVYEDFYALLSWVLLQSFAATAENPRIEAVLGALLAKGYSTERLEELTVSERGADSWLSLYARLPGRDLAEDAAIKAVIAGRF